MIYVCSVLLAHVLLCSRAHDDGDDVARAREFSGGRYIARCGTASRLRPRWPAIHRLAPFRLRAENELARLAALLAGAARDANVRRLGILSSTRRGARYRRARDGVLHRERACCLNREKAGGRGAPGKVSWPRVGERRPVRDHPAAAAGLRTATFSEHGGSVRMVRGRLSLSHLRPGRGSCSAGRPARVAGSWACWCPVPFLHFAVLSLRYFRLVLCSHVRLAHHAPFSALFLPCAAFARANRITTTFADVRSPAPSARSRQHITPINRRLLELQLPIVYARVKPPQDRCAMRWRRWWRAHLTQAISGVLLVVPRTHLAHARAIWHALSSTTRSSDLNRLLRNLGAWPLPQLDSGGVPEIQR
jgi:hypothetical protein